jgi:uncharacterized protein (DUF2141 family)
MIVSLIALATVIAAPISAVAQSADAESANLQISVEGIETQTGNLMIALFASADGFKDSKSVAGLRLEANAETLSAGFEDLEPGVYAIKMFHDVDGNSKLNTNMFGIPSEPFGFSNDAPVRFGPPKWQAARFEVIAGDNTQTIHLATAGR